MVNIISRVLVIVTSGNLNDLYVGKTNFIEHETGGEAVRDCIPYLNPLVAMIWTVAR